MFLTKRKASVGDRSPWGDFWFTPIGSIMQDGARVTGDNAMRLTAVWACVRVLAETCAVLPFTLYKPRATGGKQKVTDHWLYTLMAKRPNRYQTAFEWREMLQGHLCLRGNSFCQIVPDNRGGIAELVPLHPDRMKIEMLDNGSYRYRLQGRNGTETIFRRDEIWHLKGLSSDGIVGINPIEMHAQSIGLGLNQQSYASRFFANDAKPSGGWIEFPGKFADRTARQTFRESWQEQQGNANRGKVAVLEAGMKYHEVGINNRDSQFLESRELQTNEICRIFRVPPHKVQDLTHATFSNIEQQSIEFVIDTMLPWIERWESSIECNLIGEDEGLEVEFDVKRLLRGDAAARATYYHNGILDGWLTRNEARDEEGRDPLDGLDEPLRPLNMVEEGATPDEIAENDGGADDVPKPASTDPDMDARLVALASATAERIARKEVAAVEAAKGDKEKVREAYYGHINFVANALGISGMEAALYCGAQAKHVMQHGSAGLHTLVVARITQLATTGRFS